MQSLGEAFSAGPCDFILLKRPKMSQGSMGLAKLAGTFLPDQPPFSALPRAFMRRGKPVKVSEAVATCDERFQQHKSIRQDMPARWKSLGGFHLPLWPFL